MQLRCWYVLWNLFQTPKDQSFDNFVLIFWEGGDHCANVLTVHIGENDHSVCYCNLKSKRAVAITNTLPLATVWKFSQTPFVQPCKRRPIHLETYICVIFWAAACNLYLPEVTLLNFQMGYFPFGNKLHQNGIIYNAIFWTYWVKVTNAWQMFDQCVTKMRLNFGHAGGRTFHRLLHAMGRRDRRRTQDLLFPPGRSG